MEALSKEAITEAEGTGISCKTSFMCEEEREREREWGMDVIDMMWGHDIE